MGGVGARGFWRQVHQPWVFDVILRTENPFHSPLSLLNIVKIAANIAAVLLLIGIVMIIQNRINDKERKMNTSFADWFFIGVIFAIVASGLGAEILRLAGIGALAFSVYFIHLVAVFCLIAYFPFSKFAHLVYRFVAIVYAKHTGVDVKLK